MKKLYFTTSWDDGSSLDLKIADLLSHHSVKGTFYIPQKFDGNGEKFSAYGRRLTEEEIRKLASCHEIGGHSLTHRSLTGLTLAEVQDEVVGSQEFIRNITGLPVKMFCFPNGKFDDQVIKIVSQAGFIGARTTRKPIIQRLEDSFLMDITTICQPFPFRKKDSKQYNWRKLFDPAFAYGSIMLSLSWLSLAKKLFRRAHQAGNYFHLYGHAWEIEKYDMWRELEAFLVFVKSYENVVHLTNSEIVEQI